MSDISFVKYRGYIFNGYISSSVIVFLLSFSDPYCKIVLTDENKAVISSVKTTTIKKVLDTCKLNVCENVHKEND